MPTRSCRIATTASWVYLGILFTWLTLNLLTGDRYVVVALLGFLAVYLFFPLILVLVVVIACKHLWLAGAFLVGLLAFASLWGKQFIPSRAQSPGDTPVLKVMTFNVLAWHNFTEPIVDTIRGEDADVVFIQELNNNLANVLERDLSEIYPYQVLVPEDNPSGIGVISKFPIHATGEGLPHRWIGGPQVLQLEWQNQLLTIVNIHMFSTTEIFPLRHAEHSFRLREQQAQLLADLARRVESVIIAGDANSSNVSDAYRIISSELSDSFAEAGFGLGHTFPGSDVPGSDRPKIGNWSVPRWWTRIDYVFHSDDWATKSARMAIIDGVSDHRGVVVELVRNQ